RRRARRHCPRNRVVVPLRGLLSPAAVGLRQFPLADGTPLPLNTGAAHATDSVPLATKGHCMRLSTRNQLAGTVDDGHRGGIMAAVKVKLGTGETITAAITREAAEELALAKGSSVTVLVKATEVMLAIE